jgi:hypothetical protein
MWFDWERYFDPIRYRWFTPSRWGLFHYTVFGNRHNGRTSQVPLDCLNRSKQAHVHPLTDFACFAQVSGRSRGIPGHDFLVTLGGWKSQTGTTEEQAGTFLHELGHNLGLRHGGSDNVGTAANPLPPLLRGRVSLICPLFLLVCRRQTQSRVDHEPYLPSLTCFPFV